MRIGIYTDVHCCYTSSILPIHCKSSKYSVRLQMIIDTFRWMYETFRKNNVDLIINCGDLFDSYNIRAEEVCAMSEALSHGGDIPEIHVLGNHEIVDNHRTFYANGLLSQCSHIKVVDQPLKLQNGISLLPYMPWNNAVEVIPMLSNRYLFSHVDIKGSAVTPQHCLTEGVDPDKLTDFFELVVNGHLHSPQSWRNKIFNIGATTSLSFSDNSSYRPRVSILDTTTNNFQFFTNPYAITFIKASISNIEELRNYLNSYPKVMRIQCASALKPEIEQILVDREDVVAYRIQTTDAQILTEAEAPSVDTAVDGGLITQFREFITSFDDLKYPVDDYIRVINEMEANTVD